MAHPVEESQSGIQNKPQKIVNALKALKTAFSDNPRPLLCRNSY